MKMLNRVHVPTALCVVVIVLTLFVLYHLAFGRRGSRPVVPAGY